MISNELVLEWSCIVFNDWKYFNWLLFFYYQFIDVWFAREDILWILDILWRSLFFKKHIDILSYLKCINIQVRVCLSDSVSFSSSSFPFPYFISFFSKLLFKFVLFFIVVINNLIWFVFELTQVGLAARTALHTRNISAK